MNRVVLAVFLVTSAILVREDIRERTTPGVCRVIDDRVVMACIGPQWWIPVVVVWGFCLGYGIVWMARR